MRAGFGLIGILAFLIAVILFWYYAYLPYTQQVVRSGQSAQQQAEQIAGVDSTLGGRVTEHVKFDPVMAGNKLRGLRVTSIALGSSFQSHYGILIGDMIDQIGPQNVRDFDDAGMAEALAYEAYQRQWELGVVRNGQHIMLPQKQVVTPLAPAAPGTPAAPATPAPSAPSAPGQTAAPANAQPGQPAQPAQPAKPYQSPLNRQLDAITNYGQ